MPDGELSAALVRSRREDRQPQPRADRPLGLGDLGPAAQLRPAGRPRHAQAPVQVGGVLVGDQDLGDVALGGEAEVDAVSGQRRGEVRERGHASVRDRSLVPVMTPDQSELRRDAHGDIAYAVRRSDRARRVRITVDPVRGVEVVLPRRARARAAADAVRELEPWIRRRLAELEAARSVVAARGDTVPYLGSTLRLVREPGRTRVPRRGDALHVPAGDDAGAAVERWYRRAARGEIGPRLDRACAVA